MDPLVIMDGEIASKVMGWHFYMPGHYEMMADGVQSGWRDENHKLMVETFRPSTDLKDAWRVVRRFQPYIKLDARGVKDDRNVWQVTVWTGGPEIHGYGDTVCLAICDAALRAVVQ
jgi:hypothetical protein